MAKPQAQPWVDDPIMRTAERTGLDHTGGVSRPHQAVLEFEVQRPYTNAWCVSILWLLYVAFFLGL